MRRKASILVSSLFGLLSLTMLQGLQAQTPAPPQEQPIAITGGTIHTITQGTIPNGSLLFAEGKIVAVGNNIDIPAGTIIIDASGKHIYPGLIHAHTTLGLTEIGRIAESTDLVEIGNINPNIRAQVAVHPISEHIPVAAVNGVLTAVPTPRGGLISGMPAALMTDGWTWEQMTLREGIAMAVNWPGMRDMASYRENMAELQESFDKARRYKQARKNMQPGVPPQHPYDSRWEAMLPLLNGEMPVVISVGELRQIQAAIAWVEKEGLQAILAGSRDFDLVANQLAEKGISVMLTGVISGPQRQWQSYGEGYGMPLHLHEAGVLFSIAGDGSAAYAFRLPHHAASAVAFGLPEDEGLKAVTINPAKMLGIDDLVGSIEPGKDATFMITSDTPLQMWTQYEQVFIQGRKVDMIDKQRRLYDLYQEKQRQAQQ